MSRFSTLDAIVHDVMGELDADTTKYYRKYLRFATRGYAQLKLLALPQIEVAYLTIGDNLTANFPDDYLNYTAIGVCVAGRIYTLTLNDNLCLNRKVDDCGVSIETVAETPNDKLNRTGGYWFMPSWRNGKFVGESYGTKGGINAFGYYRIDEKLNRIQFANVQAGMEVILEYIGTGIDCNGNSLVPPYAIEPLISWVMWKRLENNPVISLGEKKRAELAYYSTFQTMVHIINDFTMDEYFDDRLSSSTSSVMR